MPEYASAMIDASLPDITAALRDGSLSAESLAEGALARQERFAGVLGAYKSVDQEITRRQARAAAAAFAAAADLGPLQGVPASVKDLYGVSGFPVFAGTARRLPASFEAEGPVIASFQRQLGVVTGKTHTVEIAFGGLGTNAHWGTPRNPWDAEAHRVPGGSSAGAGVSLCEGSALIAFGTDTAGSVRIPAAMTGTVGLKLTQGRWPIDGIFPLSPTLDTPGILARTVTDAALGFRALDKALGRGTHAASAIDLSSIRLGVPEAFFWDECSPGVAEGVREALGALEKRGVRLVPFRLPETDEATLYFRKGGLAAAEAYAFVRYEAPHVLDDGDPNVGQRMAEAGTLPAHEYLHRRRRLAVLATSANDRFADVDAFATPTVPITPPTIEEVAKTEQYRPLNLLALRNTSIPSLLGLCAITLPVALDKAGMPVGLQLVMQGRREARLLDLATAAEAALGTARQRLGTPPLCRG